MSKKAEKGEKAELEKKTSETKKEVKKQGEVAPAEEAKPAAPVKVEKPRPEKKKKEEKGIHVLYRTEADKCVRLRPVCERCGAGYFMADHGNRYTCGHCGFTHYKPKKE